VRAGDRAGEAFAFDRAVKLYERSLTLDPKLSPLLRPKLGDAYANAGRGREAADVYLVRGGTGTGAVRVDGIPTTSVVVGGEPTLYRLVGPGPSRRAPTPPLRSFEHRRQKRPSTGELHG